MSLFQNFKFSQMKYSRLTIRKAGVEWCMSCVMLFLACSSSNEAIEIERPSYGGQRSIGLILESIWIKSKLPMLR